MDGNLDNLDSFGDLESKTLEEESHRYGLRDTLMHLGKTVGDILVFTGLGCAVFYGVDYAFPEKMNEAIHNIQTPRELLIAGSLLAVSAKITYDLSKFMIRDIYRTFKKSE